MFPDRMYKIDAAQPVDHVFQEAYQKLEELFF
jgi:thymidylate kinase